MLGFESRFDKQEKLPKGAVVKQGVTNQKWLLLLSEFDPFDLKSYRKPLLHK